MKNDIRTVCLSKPVKGELRTRDIEIIAGEKRTNTIHKEYGLKFEIDIKKTYFSPRLSTERKRIADLVKPGEIVVDMFTGVAPFSIMIAKFANPKIIYSLDKNKDAVYYARRNVLKNNVLDKIEVIHSDTEKIHFILDKKKVKTNRVIMNLPFSAYLFFDNALDIIANTCVIHYYDILKENKISNRIKELKKKAEKVDINLADFKINKIKTYAPREFYIGIDITAKKNADVA
jgi:tRNA (guanine37-N1)-methyltransferase